MMVIISSYKLALNSAYKRAWPLADEGNKMFDS
jgi:hypothetical protein